MKIAVIGAGIVGIVTAYELASDGHEVVVFERAGAAAEGASFGPSGLIAPNLTMPFSHPTWPDGRWIQRLFSALPGSWVPSLRTADLRWLLQWKTVRVRDSAEFLSRFKHGAELIRNSQQRLEALSNQLGIEFERAQGQVVVYPTDALATQAQAKLETLKELGISFKSISPSEARLLEPGLAEDFNFSYAAHFPDAEVGNCRQFALALRSKSQDLGVQYCFDAKVEKINADGSTQIHVQGQGDPRTFDHAIVCTGEYGAALTQMLGSEIRTTAISGYSLSAAVKEPLNAPRGAIHDVQSGTTIVRTGNRLRVSGGFEIGGNRSQKKAGAVKPLYDALLQSFPGAAKLSSGTQTWKGTVGLTHDGLPYIGPTNASGLWLNLGHGLNGWAMACGSARLIADAIAKSDPAVDPTAFAVHRGK